jgi:SAM-dependent methyltransferase
MSLKKSNQKIYGWRGAINAFEYNHNKNIDIHTLTHSFRFGPVIANAANQILDFKKAGVNLIGCDRYSTIEEADKNVYSNKEYMFQYMIGVALSQFLWQNHKEIFDFYRKNISNSSGDKFLEIGCGHGMFFIEAIKQNRFQSYKAVDLSPSSIELTKNFVNNYFEKNLPNVEIKLQDIFDFDEDEKFDFINMGEVLEHVENPKKLLDRIYELLTNNGKAYLSTCANCPAVDHIYLYKNVDEIKSMFNSN